MFNMYRETQRADQYHHHLVNQHLVITATLSCLLCMKCLCLSFYALAPLTKCSIVTPALCHLPSPLMEKVRE